MVRCTPNAVVDSGTSAVTGRSWRQTTGTVGSGGASQSVVNETAMGSPQFGQSKVADAAAFETTTVRRPSQSGHVNDVEVGMELAPASRSYLQLPVVPA